MNMILINLLFSFYKFNKVFFRMNPKHNGGRLSILHKKPKSEQVMANIYDNCIDTHANTMFSLEAPLEVVDVSNKSTLLFVEFN
jgi:hypothetical protein